VTRNFSQEPDGFRLDLSSGQKIKFIPGYDVIAQGLWKWTGDGWTKVSEEEFNEK
jgi:urease beta subunit